MTRTRAFEFGRSKRAKTNLLGRKASIAGTPGQDYPVGSPIGRAKAKGLAEIVTIDRDDGELIIGLRFKDGSVSEWQIKHLEIGEEKSKDWKLESE